MSCTCKDLSKKVRQADQNRAHERFHELLKELAAEQGGCTARANEALAQAAIAHMAEMMPASGRVEVHHAVDHYFDEAVALRARDQAARSPRCGAES